VAETELSLSVVGVPVSIGCADSHARALLELTCEGFGVSAQEPSALGYRIERSDSSGAFVVARDDGARLVAQDEADMLWTLDGDLVVEIQKRRPELYFLHAGVLELGQRAFVLAAPSGHGKSTTTWALLHHGFRFLSDELAPLDLQSLTVHPFPRALCVKRDPPAPYPLPAGCLRTSRQAYVPTRYLPAPVWTTPLPVAATFFLRLDLEASRSMALPVSRAEACARLYANSLNSLAHSADGLDAALRIAEGQPCFELVSADLTETALLIRRTAESLVGSTS
jgi:hypothetical protein